MTVEVGFPSSRYALKIRREAVCGSSSVIGPANISAYRLLSSHMPRLMNMFSSHSKRLASWADDVETKVCTDYGQRTRVGTCQCDPATLSRILDETEARATRTTSEMPALH